MIDNLLFTVVKMKNKRFEGPGTYKSPYGIETHRRFPQTWISFPVIFLKLHVSSGAMFLEHDVWL
ncbi:hypothetical protein EDS67_17320 [candidate division KSB1 bacterium]|nr:MAG: hypothetical protein EDS67_17320 [candidate division KSB1 bacterium]MBC6949769.1 hypothetical protein [candidate division KSB1 bacterium]MCE7943034.1 hypothetical protein [Chlorobi bacterium CHB1]